MKPRGLHQGGGRGGGEGARGVMQIQLLEHTQGLLCANPPSDKQSPSYLLLLSRMLRTTQPDIYRSTATVTALTVSLPPNARLLSSPVKSSQMKSNFICIAHVMHMHGPCALGKSPCVN